MDLEIEGGGKGGAEAGTKTFQKFSKVSALVRLEYKVTVSKRSVALVSQKSVPWYLKGISRVSGTGISKSVPWYLKSQCPGILSI